MLMIKSAGKLIGEERPKQE